MPTIPIDMLTLSDDGRDILDWKEEALALRAFLRDAEQELAIYRIGRTNLRTMLGDLPDHDVIVRGFWDRQGTTHTDLDVAVAIIRGLVSRHLDMVNYMGELQRSRTFESCISEMRAKDEAICGMYSLFTIGEMGRFAQLPQTVQDTIDLVVDMAQRADQPSIPPSL